ncbi:hypothetical protein BFN03_00605 [Rhodococcus sp. WMMA185]|uniref:hypothetical protein n=1 Tax=Rhodococcus sp. WMMA185 TaxID=679318 RepID=UPI000878AF5C|nr:hypothetical protein [Rhodococcus sp. WMMA185]AOW91686.1 hypothetical protein BFN03_00605 [Rhodococcus sp. WMMA185]
MRIGRIVNLVVIVWLVIGAAAVFQRGYFDEVADNCSTAATIAATVLVGPLNYTGANPKVDCELPQPSQ